MPASTFARVVLAVKEGENEPDFNLPQMFQISADDELVETFRQDLLRILSTFDPDELRPTEQRSRRVLALAEGKGIDSLLRSPNSSSTTNKPSSSTGKPQLAHDHVDAGKQVVVARPLVQFVHTDCDGDVRHQPRIKANTPSQ